MIAFTGELKLLLVLLRLLGFFALILTLCHGERAPLFAILAAILAAQSMR
jgi:hypothetical protein